MRKKKMEPIHIYTHVHGYTYKSIEKWLTAPNPTNLDMIIQSNRRKEIWIQHYQPKCKIDARKNMNLIAGSPSCKIDVAAYSAHPIRWNCNALMTMTRSQSSIWTCTSSWLTTPTKYSTEL
jgi:hypothetical protein